jgi:hypothetical protein
MSKWEKTGKVLKPKKYNLQMIYEITLRQLTI